MEGMRVDHIAVAVSNLDKALEFYSESLGVECLGIEVVEEQGVRVAKLEVGNTHIELLEPLAEDTPVGKFIAKRGEGLHHICLGVENIESGIESLLGAGVRMIDEKPKIGAGGAKIAFVHPKSTGGVLLELSQPEKQTH